MDYTYIVSHSVTLYGECAGKKEKEKKRKKEQLQTQLTFLSVATRLSASHDYWTQKASRSRLGQESRGFGTLQSIIPHVKSVLIIGCKGVFVLFQSTVLGR